MRRIVLLLLIIFLSSIVIRGDIDIPVSSGGSSSSSGGGGSRLSDIDMFTRQLEYWKNNYPDKYEILRKLLYIEPFVTKSYNNIIPFRLDIVPNKNLTRNDEFTITATVWNPNPIEVRRVLYLNLYVLEPGAKSFRKVNSAPVMILNNEYIEANGYNVSIRSFPELTSFSNLKTVGSVVLKLNATDGLNNWDRIPTCAMEIINRPPELENLTLQIPAKPRFNDPITYLANVTDPDGDLINVTLHILDSKGYELKNVTQIASSGERVSFVANQYGFFNKADSGKNFSYYYTYSDGIAVRNTSIQNGPSLRKSTSIWVGKPIVVPEDDRQYWWQNYNFSLEMKNLDQEPAEVLVSLYTDTRSSPWKTDTISQSKKINLTKEPQTVYFNVRPFRVSDANQIFGFRFKYSEIDQNQKDYIDAVGGKPLNAKLIRYEFVSGTSLGNILVMLLFAFLIAMFIERRFYR
ncbi:MAG: hypothetical protein ACE14P_13030 [Methanotrichaceae archaeon]